MQQYRNRVKVETSGVAPSKGENVWGNMSKEDVLHPAGTRGRKYAIGLAHIISLWCMAIGLVGLTLCCCFV